MIVKERGSLESAANKDSLCEVEGGTTIIKILPEGTKVKEGDLVCELDSASLKDALTTQKITTTQADASYQQAKLVREVAEYAVREYVEGVFKQDEATAKGEIALAKSDLERAIDRLDWSTKMLKKGYVSRRQQVADKLSKDRAVFDLEQAQTQLDVLLKYTKDKQIKSLQSDVEKAKADELSKQSSWELEKTKEAKLERQIKACILKAPGDGIVVYANDPNKMGGGGGQQQVQIEEGATVRERQKIFSLPDVTKMRVNTKVHESMVEKVRPGLRALVRVEAAAGQAIRGAGRQRRPDGRLGRVLLLRHQGLHHPRRHRGRHLQAPPPPRDERPGRDPGRRARQRPERPGPGDPPVQGQGLRLRHATATGSAGPRSSWGSPTTSTSRSRRASRTATRSP